MTFSDVIAVIAIAMLQGALVALPRAEALKGLGRLRSSAWAAVLPGVITVGTLGLLAMPSIAPGLILLASVATPLLAGLAVVGVARGQRAALLAVAIAVTIATALGSGWFGQLSASTLTALGCLPLGVALVRLTPTRWIPIGVLTMCAIDVALLGLNVGQPASSLVADARARVQGTVLEQAEIGSISTEYLDLLLAAVLGGVLAGRAIQRRAALLVATLAAGYGMLLPLVHPLPATVPVALAVILLRCGVLSQSPPLATRPAHNPA